MIRHDPLMLRVSEIEVLSPSLKRILLASADGAPLPVAAPGAHVSLTLEAPDKVFRNSYSVVSVAAGGYELIVRKVAQSRGGSVFVHESLKQGDVLASTVPFNLFPIQAGARKRLLIGGGIGVTPLLSFVQELRRRGERFAMVQFVQEDERTVFQRLIDNVGASGAAIRTGIPGPADIEALLAGQPLGTEIYMCGPAGLMAVVDAAAERLGWPPGHIHREVFGAVGGMPFTAKLGRSGREIEVGEHQSLLEAIEQAGVPIRSLCRGGACGECRTVLVGGEPEHRDHFLSNEEKASGTLIMPCVSRARSAQLVLDI